MEFTLALIAAYIVGSLPFSYIVPKLIRNVDIRTVGSKNVGATNVYRTCGLLCGLIALLLDSGKAGFSLYFAKMYFPIDLALMLGIVVVIGHCHSVFLKFKGGKGVASAAGLFLFFDPKFCLILLIIFVLILLLSSYVSLASIMTAFFAPMVYYALYRDLKMTGIIVFLVVFVIVRHRSNIVRLTKGEESKIKGWKK